VFLQLREFPKGSALYYKISTIYCESGEGFLLGSKLNFIEQDDIGQEEFTKQGKVGWYFFRLSSR
jgi:hypothetical protein